MHGGGRETQVQSPGSGDPLEKRTTGYPLQYSHLQNALGREARLATVHGVPKWQTRRSSGKVATGCWVPEAPDGLLVNIPQDPRPDFAQLTRLGTAQGLRWRLRICWIHSTGENAAVQGLDGVSSGGPVEDGSLRRCSLLDT